MREGREEETQPLLAKKKTRKKRGIKLIYDSKGTINKVILSCEKKTADKKMSSNRSVV